MSYKQLKRRLNRYSEANDKLIRRTEEIQSNLFTWLAINQSYKEQIEYLLTALHEIKDTTNDNLTIWVVKNAIEKHNLNILIANRKNQDA